jgi:hypothetical protein
MTRPQTSVTPFTEIPAFVLAFVGLSADFELLLRVDTEVGNAS